MPRAGVHGQGSPSLPAASARDHQPDPLPDALAEEAVDERVHAAVGRA